MGGRYNKYTRQFATFAVWTMLVFPVFMGWNGFLYPDLTFRNSVGKAYTADGELRKEVTGKEFYEELLSAEPEQIHVKSRLLEFFFYFIQ